MNILCFAPIDNGGQMINLTEALNKYTDHDARCITATETYLGYDTDITLKNHTPKELTKTLSDRDFFIFSEYLPQHSFVAGVLNKINLSNRIKPENTIIRTAGTVSRNLGHSYRSAWVNDGWMFAGPLGDWTLTSQIGRMAPVNYICPTSKIPVARQKDAPIRICCSATTKAKGVDAFVSTVNQLIGNGYDVKGVLIQGQAWKDSVAAKSLCHITFDQFMIPSYANSAIESMWLGHAVVSDISSWCRLVHPDLPITDATDKHSLYRALVDLIENKELDWIGKIGHDYVMKHHTPSVVANQWDTLIEHVTKQ